MEAEVKPGLRRRRVGLLRGLRRPGGPTAVRAVPGAGRPAPGPPDGGRGRRPRRRAGCAPEAADAALEEAAVLGGGLLALAALAVAGVLYRLEARHYESTDDASIDGYISQVATQVPGRVIRIAFNDNRYVRAGQLLLELDARNYQVSLDQAAAQRSARCSAAG